jgi:multidrug efflux pump subunit AcrA (membrane-fusion protein)
MMSRPYLAALLCLMAVAQYSEPIRAEAVVESALLQLVEQVDVPARTAGVLSTISVDEGSMVEAGATVGQIDDSQTKLLYHRAELELKLSQEKSRSDVAIRAAQQTLAFAKSELNRIERASTNLPGSISQSQLAETKLKVGKAGFELENAEQESRQNKLTEELKQQELALGKYEIDVRRITAPVPGIVVEVMRHQGEWVEPGDKVIRIVRIDRLRAEGLIHVDSVAQNWRNVPANIYVDLPGQGEKHFAGKVVFVSPEVNPVNGLVRISAEFENTGNVLKPGLRAKIYIPSASAVDRSEKKAG